MKPKRVYLDYAASTPVAPEVLKAMAPYWSEEFGNPGSLHSFGQAAMAAVDKSRETVAKAIGADFREVIFTGSATEANNLALRGTVRATISGNQNNFAPAAKFSFPSARGSSKNSETKPASPAGYSRRMSARPVKVIISSIEHESVLDTARDLEKDGVEVIYVPVDRKGIVDVKKIKEALDEQTVLVSVMYVNNEIGSVQPIAEISKLISEFRKQKVENRSGKNSRFYFLDSGFPLFHTDAAQAFNYFDCGVKKLGVDLMTLSGQKIYGPKGIGALYIRKPQPTNYSLQPIITGGGQEFGLRSGTENVPAIAGFGKAVELAERGRNKNTKDVKALRDYFWRGLKRIYPQAEMNGNSKAPHILNVYFPTEYAGDLLVKLDMAGVAASSGSACSARAFSPSHVLQALGLSQERVRGSLRFSFGKTLRIEDLKRALKQIEGVIR